MLFGEIKITVIVSNNVSEAKLDNLCDILSDFTCTIDGLCQQFKSENPIIDKINVVE